MDTKSRLRQNLAFEKMLAKILYTALKELLANRNAETIGKAYSAVLEYERRHENG